MVNVSFMTIEKNSESVSVLFHPIKLSSEVPDYGPGYSTMIMSHPAWK